MSENGQYKQKKLDASARDFSGADFFMYVCLGLPVSDLFSTY